jgi:hypothetical protein
MNDLEREVRDTLRGHQADAPLLEIADARRLARQAHRRQVRNMVVGGIVGAAVVIGGIAGFDGLLRSDGRPIGSDPPPPSRMCAATAGPVDAGVHGWPGPTRNPAGVYSWDKYEDAGGREGFIHNAYSPGSGDMTILIEGETGRLIPHRGQTTTTVAGCEATYRRFDAEDGGEDNLSGDFAEGGTVEEWMVDIQGTTVTISIAAKPGAPGAEVAEAQEIVQSIRAEPQDSVLGFRLLFTLKTNTWDSG